MKMGQSIRILTVPAPVVSVCVNSGNETLETDEHQSVLVDIS